MTCIVWHGVLNAAADWTVDLKALLEQEKPNDTAINQVAGSIPTYEALLGYIDTMTFPAPVRKPDFVQFGYPGLDGVTRPFVLYIPGGYDPARKTLLLVYLHGGVGRQDIEQNPIGYARANDYIAWAELHNWFVLFPYGQRGATWWDTVGLDNIRGQVVFCKRHFNIDDNRIAVTGFSDGASGCFGLAMLQPDLFSCFIPLNGHISVASIDGKLPLYASNLISTPIYAINTDLDEQYPDSMISPMMALVMSAGADLNYRVYYGIGHDFAYARQALPAVVDFIETHPRDPFPTHIAWESSRPEFGRRHWLKIDTICTGPKARWHKDYNLRLLDDRVSFGFFYDETYTGQGIRIASLLESEEETFCMKAGLQSGDILLQADKTILKSIDDLNAYKSTIKRGDRVTLVIERDQQRKKIKASMPKPTQYDLFLIEPSGKVNATRLGNTLTVDSSNVSQMTVYLHPRLITFDKPITITVNGRTLFEEECQPNIEYALRDFLDRRDRTVVYAGEITLEPVTNTFLK